MSRAQWAHGKEGEYRGRRVFYDRLGFDEVFRGLPKNILLYSQVVGKFQFTSDHNCQKYFAHYQPLNPPVDHYYIKKVF